MTVKAKKEELGLAPYNKGPVNRIRKRRWQPNTERALAYVKDIENERKCYPETTDGEQAFWRAILNK